MSPAIKWSQNTKCCILCWEGLWTDRDKQEKCPSWAEMSAMSLRGKEIAARMNWLCNDKFVLSRYSFFFFVHLFFPLFSFLFEWNTNYFIHTHTQEKEREGRNEHLDLIELKNMHIRNTFRPDSIPISVLSWLPTSYLDNHYSELGIYQGLVSLLDLYKAHFPKFSFSCFLTW